MKRSLIAIGALLLLLSSATYANPPKPRRTVRRAPAWISVLCWLGHSHHHGYERCAPRREYGHLPPGHRGKSERGWGWHWGWDNGRHKGWDRHDRDNRERRGPDRRNDGEREHGRRGGRG